MSLHTKAEFARLTGKSKAHVSMGIKRKQIILSGDYIDDTIHKNKTVMNRWIHQSSKAKVGKIAPPVEEKPKAPKGIKPPSQMFSDVGLDDIKKQAEIDLKIAQIERTNLQNQKLRGDSIPTDLVKSTVSILGHSFQSSYKNGAEAFIIDFCHRMKAPAKIEAEMKGKIIKLINKSHSNAIIEAKKSIESIVEQNAVVKNSDEDE